MVEERIDSIKYDIWILPKSGIPKSDVSLAWVADETQCIAMKWLLSGLSSDGIVAIA
jgi:hypothetical protein